MTTETQDSAPKLQQTITNLLKTGFAFMMSFSRRRPVAASLLGLSVVLLLFMAFRSGDGSAELSGYYEVERGDFLVSIIEGGTLQAVKEVTVRNDVYGNSRIIYIIPEGTYVKKGDLIVQIDKDIATRDLNERLIRYEDDKADFAKSQTDLVLTQSSVESDIRKAELNVKFAQMDLEKFEQIEKEQEIRNAEIEIFTAQESLKLAEERLEWSKRLTDEGFETKSNLDRDQLSVMNQRLGLEKADSIKKMLKEFDLTKLEAEYRADLEEALQQLERVKRQGESKINQAKTQLEIDRRQMELGKQKLEIAQKQLAATDIYAPQDGLVVYATSSSRYSSESIIEEGAMVRQRQAVVKIPDTSEMKVEIKVHESHINQIQLGQTAFVVLDSLPDDRFRGEVSKIAILPDAQSRYGNSNLKVYNTEILITDDLPDVKPGVSARAEVVITNLEDVIKVPIQCVTTVGGKQVCYIKSLGGPKPVPVEIGLFNNKFIEIRSGLEAGDSILLSPPLDTSEDIAGELIGEDDKSNLKTQESPKEQGPIQPAHQPNPENRKRQGQGKRPPLSRSDS